MRLTLLALATVVLLAACGSGQGAEPPVDPATADYTITTADMAFESGTLTVAGGQAFTLALVNTDTMSHNVAIYTDDTRSEKMFEGTPVTSGTVLYEISALAPGESFFDCTLHPSMTGTLVVEG